MTRSIVYLVYVIIVYGKRIWPNKEDMFAPFMQMIIQYKELYKATEIKLPEKSNTRPELGNASPF